MAVIIFIFLAAASLVIMYACLAVFDRADKQAQSDYERLLAKQKRPPQK